MKSRVFSSKLLKNSISGGMWVPVFLSIGFLFVFPIATLLLLGDWQSRFYTLEQLQLLCNMSFSSELLGIGMLGIAGSAFLNALLGYFYLYSREKIDFYHSLPVSRTHMFLQKLYMGIIYTFIPYGIMLFFSLLIMAFRGFFHPGMLLLALKMALIHFLCYLFIYFCFVLILSMTGNILMGVLSIGGFCLYGPCLSLLLTGYSFEFLRTYSHDGTQFLSFLGNVSPIYILSMFIDSNAAGKQMLLTLSLALLFGCLSYLAYVKRASESTGKSIVYPWFALLLKFLMVLPCGLAFGLIMSSIQNSSKEFWGIFGLLAGTVLTKGMMEVLYSFDFRSFLKYKIQTLLSILFVFGIACMFLTDFIGFQKYIPAYDKIEGINLENFDFANQTYIEMEDNGRASLYNNLDAKCMLYQDDNELGKNLYQILKKIVDQNVENEYSSDIYYSHRYNIQYKLKSGGWVSREYFIDSETLQELLQILYDETNYKELMISALQNVPDKYLTSISGVFADKKDYSIYPNLPEKQKALAEAFMADFMETKSADILNTAAIAQLEFHYSGIPAFYPEEKSYLYTSDLTIEQWPLFNVYPEYKRTIALLKETGFPLDVTELNYQEAEIHFYLPDGIEAMTSDFGPFLINKEADLQELKECMIPFETNWQPFLPEISIAFHKAGDEDDSYAFYYLLEDHVPSCVQELLDKVRSDMVDETIYEG